MSVILDALRRSEGERQRGLVPTISSSHSPVGQHHQRRIWWMLLVGGALTLPAVHFLPGRPAEFSDDDRLTRREARVEPAAYAPPLTSAEAAGSTEASAKPTGESGKPASVPARREPLETAAVQGTPALSATPVTERDLAARLSATDAAAGAEKPDPPVERALPDARQRTHAVVAGKAEVHPGNDVRRPPLRRTASDTSGPGRKTPSPAVRSTPPPSAAASGRQVTSPVQSNEPPMFWELPDPIMQSMADLRVTMHVYSENASDRFVRLNGATYRERDRVDHDLVVEAITEQGAVMSYKGTRFRVER